MSYTPPDYGGYERSKRDADYRYGRESAANAYGRFVSQQRGSRQLGDMERGFKRSWPGFKAGFGARGLSGGGVESGVMQRAMNNYLGDYARSYGRTQQDLSQGLQQYDLGQSQLNDWYQQTQADIEAAKANEIASSAQNILFLRQMLGGL